ncbi:MAG: hypothetical protein OXE86_09285 [Alphaproteobacteria bacterium]|nr:hypothetical protein [Alphaproteobacteria bacterium]
MTEEEEARLILAEAVAREATPQKGLGTAIHELFKPFGGVELGLPPREAPRRQARGGDASCSTAVSGSRARRIR